MRLESRAGQAPKPCGLQAKPGYAIRPEWTLHTTNRPARFRYSAKALALEMIPANARRCQSVADNGRVGHLIAAQDSHGDQSRRSKTERAATAQPKSAS